MALKILFFGDIVGKIGRRGMTEILPKYKKEFNPDLIVVNAENLAHGIGITGKTLEEMRRAGVNFFTSGNHIWKKEQANEILSAPDSPIIRPANYPGQLSGKGEKTLEIGTKKLLMVNLIGQVFMEDKVDSPFKKFDEILKRHEHEKLNGILVDFHAEATSEKVAFGHYVDGRASVIIGTHTHVATADPLILDQGTGYLTDVGMVGAKDSVIGVDKSVIIKKFLTDLPIPHQIPEEGLCLVNAVYLEINPKTQKTTKIVRADKEIKV